MLFSTGLMFLLAVLNIVVYYLQKQQEEDDGEQKTSSRSSSSEQQSPNEGDHGKRMDSSSSLLLDRRCRLFSLAEIKLATCDFDDALIIGKGGFGNVFKGTIDGVGIDVAIKRLNRHSIQGETEFRAGIEMLSKFCHSHIVSLLGYCEESGKREKILVYEYMPNGSLEDHLHRRRADGSNYSPLTWAQRLRICIGAARGLDYLHSGTGIHCRVIHRDVKSSNILLDENWTGKISDFGLSRTGPAYESCTNNVYTDQIRGTFGYMDAEYFYTQRLTRKSDVYAFGVVLFEALCGRPALDFTLDEQQHSLARWAKHCIRDGTIRLIIDPCLRGQVSANCLKEFAQIAYKCLLSHPKDRPTMTQVVAQLEFVLALTLQKHGGRVTVIEKVWSLFSIKTPAFHTKNYNRNRQKRSSDNTSNRGILQEPAPTIAEGSRKHKIKGIKLEEDPTKAAAGGSRDNVNKGAITEEPTLTAVEGSSDNVNKGAITEPTMTAVEGSSDDIKEGDVISQFATMLKAEPLSSGLRARNLNIFTCDELRRATRNFRPSAMLGVSGGESVYKGWVDGTTYAPSISGVGIAVAIKMSNMDNVQSLKEWQTEVNRGKFSHPNLVKLLGYCSEDRMLLLVYEYMPKGKNLESLHCRFPLQWGIMMKIAIGAAQGLDFLHTTENTPLYRTFKASNILVHEEFEARLYFGSAALSRGHGALPTVMSDVSTNRYSAPEYMATGDLYVKSDVYSFGVVMLDMMVGLWFLDGSRCTSHQSLMEWARPILSDNMKLQKVMGRRFDHGDPPKGASKAAVLILRCLEVDPQNRPSMKEVVASLQEINATG